MRIMNANLASGKKHGGFLMKKKATKLLAFILCLLMLTTTMIVPISAATSSANTDGDSSISTSISDISDIMNALTYAKYREKYLKENRGKDTIVIDATNYTEYIVNKSSAKLEVKENYHDNLGGIYVPESGTVTWDFEVKTEGKYIIEIKYCQVEGKTNSIERIFYLNGEVPFSEARSIVLSKIWTYKYKIVDGKKTFYIDGKSPEDSNDIRPTVQEDLKWVTYPISDSNGFYPTPFEFYLEAGKNSISLESQRQPVVINSITIRPYEELPTYQEYIKENGSIEENKASADLSIPPVQAEAPNNVSAVTMYPVYDRTSAITQGLTGEQIAGITKYNTAGKEQWQNVGEWMSYTITVPEDGYYSIAVRYKQALLSGMYVSRRVYIDGVIPFEEANNCRFPYTSDWKTIYLGDGKTDFQFYLTKGTHELKLEVTLGEMGTQIQTVSNSLSNINKCYLEILKLTGSDPDTNRTYGFSRIMPDVLKTMLIEAGNLKGVYNYLVKESGKGEKTATIEQVYLLLEKMAKDESQIAANLQTLKSQIGSLGTWINSAKTQPLQVDFYQVQANEKELPQDEANFFVSLWYEIKLFFSSFTTDYNKLVTDETGKKKDNVEVWVVTGRDQAQIIRNLVDNKFTPETNIGVNLKLISGGTLLPSVLAGVGPDVSLMETSTTIIDYALRNAVAPLNEFIEKDLKEGEDALSAFPKAAMVPLTLSKFDLEKYKAAHAKVLSEGKEYKDGQCTLCGEIVSEGQILCESCSKKYTQNDYYGLPDSLTFSMMFYRKDVLASLDIELPTTWSDMLSILPILQYNNMEIGIVNDIYTFMYQSGYEAYSKEGMTINFDSIGVLNAFTEMCNLYTQYSLPYTFDFSNRFRTGEMPIGIAPYTTCNQLSVFASELSGLWSFVPLPGYALEDENGNEYINNSAVATVTGCVMINDSDNKEAAWEFMKWYTAKDFQVSYSNEIVSILGIAARPATANIEAITELPWTTEEADSIMRQFNNLVAVPNYPGSYYLARYVSFAFLAAYNDGMDPADALLDYTDDINKEITRRRAEFGLCTIDEYKDYLDSLKKKN